MGGKRHTAGGHLRLLLCGTWYHAMGDELPSARAAGNTFMYVAGEPTGTEIQKIIAPTKPFDDTLQSQQGQPSAWAQRSADRAVRDPNLILQDLPKDEWADGWTVFRIVSR